MAVLRLTSHLIISADQATNNSPLRRPVDWERSFSSISVSLPKSEILEVIPGEEVTVLNGTRTLAAAANTQYLLALSTLASNRYRLSHTGVGTAPGFRTARTVNIGGGSAVLTYIDNQTLTVTSTLGTIFGNVVVGDQVLIPGLTTGDTSLFNSLNEGLWTVLAQTTAQLTLIRASGSVFSAATETVAVAADSQFLVFSSTGVQVGDQVDLVAGFASSSRHNYPVVAVTANYIEFTSSTPLAGETVVPGATAVVCYSSAKRLVVIEADQEIAVKLNGETSETTIVQPWVAGNDNFVGEFRKTGITYQLIIKNRSTTTTTVTVITCE